MEPETRSEADLEVPQNPVYPRGTTSTSEGPPPPPRSEAQIPSMLEGQPQLTLTPEPITPILPVIETPPVTPAPTVLEVPEEKGFPVGALILGGTLLIVLIAGFLLFLTRSRPSLIQTQEAPTISPTTPSTGGSTPTLLQPQKFSNEFLRFEYPGDATQKKVDEGFVFSWPNGNFLRYTISSLGTSGTLQSWITKNEKCPDKIKGIPYTNPSRLQGLRINNPGGSPPCESSVIDAYYLLLGKTVHAFYLQKSDPTESERSAFNKLVDSILLNPTTKGSK